MQTQTIGSIRVDRLVESEGPFAEYDFLLPEARPELLEEHADWLRPRFLEAGGTRIIMSFHTLIVRSARYTILIDTCVGNDKPRPNRPGWHRQNKPWLSNLAAHGLQPEDIDFVLCTHLHADHVGWNTRLIDGRWQPTFPNARYLFGRREYQHWQHACQTADQPLNHGAFEDSVLPIVEAGRATLVEDDHQLDTGIWLAPAPGHTPGNVIVHLQDGGQHAILSGDVMHSALQLADPDLSSRFCSDAGQSRITRRALIDTYCDTATTLLTGHFPTPVAGRIVSHRNSFRFRFDCDDD